jgi:hypothetical protein
MSYLCVGKNNPVENFFGLSRHCRVECAGGQACAAEGRLVDGQFTTYRKAHPRLIRLAYPDRLSPLSNPIPIAQIEALTGSAR